MLMFSCRHSGVGGLTCWCMRRMVTGFSATARASTELCVVKNHTASVMCLLPLPASAHPMHSRQLPSCSCQL